MSVKDVCIEISTTGGQHADEWITVTNASLHAAPGSQVMPASAIAFNGALARYVVLTLKNGNEGTYINNIGGGYTDFGLSEVRFYGTPGPSLDVCGDVGTVYLDADVNQDCYVDMADLTQIASQWLKCTDPVNTLCVD